MQNAEHMLQALHKLGEQRQPLTRVYRCLYSEDLFLDAYAKISRNKGALTPGTSDDTADGTSLKHIHHLIEQLRQERFYFRPVRRIQVPKRRGGQRPLGLPNFSDKLVQETVRQLLEAYYEPQFRESSHGFRPGRGCHTALAAIQHDFTGTVWFIEADIRGCFNNISHKKLVEILSEKVHDGRLLNLIRRTLKAGYLEDWQYHHTYSGTPQGSIISPILTNIFLDRLDQFIEDVLIPRYTRGQKRRLNRNYRQLSHQITLARNQRDAGKVRKLEQQRRQLPSQETNDPNYRRLKYIRYCDDFILGFIGPKGEAEEIKQAIATFLQQELCLELNQDKTLITHAKTSQAQFLGYALSVYQADHKLSLRRGTKTKARSINGSIRLGLPYGLIGEHLKRYQRNGKLIHEPVLIHNSDAQIISIYQQRFRGLAEYYKYAVDRARLSKLKHGMEIALTKTLANKFKTRVSKIYRQYAATRLVDNHLYKTLQVVIATSTGTRTIYWGAIPLKVVKPGSQPLTDQKYNPRSQGIYTDLIQRLKANQCQLCGLDQDCEVHHIRKLSDLKQRWRGRKEKPEWVKVMIARQRKTIVVCRQCHLKIHAGKPTPNLKQLSSGEPDAFNGARPVRRGADGKGSEDTSPAAYPTTKVRPLLSNCNAISAVMY
jgi:group II intron reverse transcriptase/maturase